MVHRRASSVVAILAAVLALAACSSTAPAAPAAVNATAKPVVLDLATPDDSSGDAAKQILHLADVVKELSHGAVRVQPKWEAAGHPSDYDQANARLVLDGSLPLGLIPSRAWDSLGVKTLRAINTPFLLRTDAQLKAVVSDPLKKPLLAGLDQTDAVGLDLFPEGLRHPFGFGEPLVGLKDYRGALITAPTSKTTEAMFRAFGATPSSDLVPEDRGAESSYRLTDAQVATGNVVFYPKVNVLVANRKAYARLSAAQRSVLAEAAERTQTWALETQAPDVAAAAEFCRQGGRVVLASKAQLADLRKAAEPVVRGLEKDAVTGPMIDMLRKEAPHPSNAPEVKACG